MRLACALAVASTVFLAYEVRADDATLRAVEFRFTPTKHAQIAIWIEGSDGTFLSTVGLTQAVSLRGIGNRPGADQMNSGYHWPYGRREAVLPIWAHRRAAAPNAAQFPRIIFQNRPEGYASRTCEDSTPDKYFCLAFSGDSSKKGLDAVSCASGFNSDKGRKMVPSDLAAGYAEPFEAGGIEGMRAMTLTSLYPPRRDVKPCPPDDDPACRAGAARSCNDFPDVANYDAEARAAMPDIDAVTMATPSPEIETAVMFSIPNHWVAGQYVAWVEVNTEGDYNSTYNDTSYPTPDGDAWDSWARQTGYSYRGQPSVVYRVPFSLGASGTFSTSTPVGYGSVDGNSPDIAMMHAMDGTITDNPAGAPGSGADRLRQTSPETPRVAVEVRDCAAHDAPATPGEMTTRPSIDTKHSHEWGSLHFTVGGSVLPIAKYDVRFSTSPITAEDPESFMRAYRAVTADTTMTGLVVPTGQPTGASVDVDFGGLQPKTHYWIAVRAVDVCNVVSPVAVAELQTTRTNFTQLSGCFVATAAYGSALEPQVGALRQVRDRLLGANALFTAGAELYYRSGPAAADVLRRSDTARALTRTFLGPLGTLAEAGLAASRF